MKKSIFGLALAIFVFSRPRLFRRHPLPTVIDERAAAGDQPDDPGPLATDLSADLKRPAILKAMKKVAIGNCSTPRGVTTSSGPSLRSTTAFWLHRRPPATSIITIAFSRLRATITGTSDHASLTPTTKPSASPTSLFTPKIRRRQRSRPLAMAWTRLLARPDDPQKESLVVVRRALYGATGSGAALGSYRRSPLSRLHESRVVDHLRRTVRSSRTSLLPRRSIPNHARGKRAKGLLVARQRMGSCGTGAGPRAHACGLSRSRQSTKNSSRTWRSGSRVCSSPMVCGAPACSIPDRILIQRFQAPDSFTYAMAWGIRHKLLDRKKYLPVVKKSWKGMLTHVYADGRLGSIQPIGGEPGKFKPSSSYVYGVGAFLLAGSELSQIAGK